MCLRVIFGLSANIPSTKAGFSRKVLLAIKTKIINPKPIVSKYEYEFNGALYKKTVYYFLMEYVSGDPKNHDWEMSEAKFVTADEIKKTLTYSSDKEAFEKILQQL